MSEPTEALNAFLSHSSKDKDLFVRPLAECLMDQGASVWYDEYSLTPGDSLSASIDLGLSKARHGLVVISPHFIETARESGWTQYELRGIVANSIGSSPRRIVPIWLNVTRDEVRDFSPPLADVLSILAAGKRIEQVALEVLKVIAPGKATSLGRLNFLQDFKGETTDVPIDKLIRQPASDRRVAGHVVLRSLLVCNALADSGSRSTPTFEAFLEDLSRDLHHEHELRIWEAIASSYAAGCASFDLSLEERTALFELLLCASFGNVHETAFEKLPPEVLGGVLEHFETTRRIAAGEVVIGEGGFRGLIQPRTDGDAREQAEDAVD